MCSSAEAGGAQMYVRLAPKAKRCFIIDTGCGLGNLREYIEEHINTCAATALLLLAQAPRLADLRQRTGRSGHTQARTNPGCTRTAC